MLSSRLTPRAAFAALSLILGVTGLTFAGDITPPAGPIAPTAKPLSEVEPRIPIGPETTPGDASSVYRITGPGSYYLTSDVVMPSSKAHGIEIAASDVTIDLNGFTVNGEASTSTSFLAACVSGESGHARITVRNGGVIGSPDDGVDLDSTTDARVESVSARSIDGVGIRVGTRGWASDCVSSNVDGTGFEGGTDCIFERCAATNNYGHGFIIGSRTRISGCTATGNGLTSPGVNFLGIQPVGDDGLIEDNFVASNDYGIIVNGTGWTVVRNVVKDHFANDFNIHPGNHAGAAVSDPALAGPMDNIVN